MWSSVTHDRNTEKNYLHNIFVLCTKPNVGICTFGKVIQSEIIVGEWRGEEWLLYNSFCINPDMNGHNAYNLKNVHFNWSRPATLP